jgi:signal transduction histidine kinase
MEMKKEKRKVRTYPALTLRIVGLALVFWLASMVILTWAVASDMLRQIQNQLYFYADNADSRAQHNDAGLPGTLEYNMIDQLGSAYYWIDLEPLLPFVQDQHFNRNGISSDDWMWGKWELYYGYEAAEIYYGEGKEELIRTGDYLTFEYTSSANWAAQDLTPLGKSYVYLSGIPEAEAVFNRFLSDLPTGDIGINMFMPLFRLTGWFDGNEFHPIRIENGDYLSSYGRVMDIEQLCNLDSRNSLEWNLLFETNAPDGQALVTIYGWDPSGHNGKAKPVTVAGTTYGSLTDLLHASYSMDDPFSLEKHSLWEAVLIYPRGHTDEYGSFTLAVAVRCRPLLYAAARLRWVYLISAAAVGILLRSMLRRIQLELTEPLENMACAARDGYTIRPRSGWEEPSALEQHFVQSKQTIAEHSAEIVQLRTALEYAHDAEEKRKALISNITHELKTPLAIIHSYAECLSEDVLPEKRKQYSATILEETEKMDSMVLQMLELSRLEAGRVRLATESFSLHALTQSIAGKMKPLMEERNLKLQYGLVQEFTFNGDENRIGQVITNLLSNAIKYSTEGGTIRISIFTSHGTLCFRMTNAAPHLTDAALEKVWDSFYRGDESRNTPGTGLGLPLVKSIIALHGGTCSVQNTWLDQGVCAVEFGFDLPIQ